MDRRRLIGAAAGLASGTAWSTDTRPALAITIDDFRLADTPLMTALARDAAIRAALDRHRIRAAGFVAGRYVDEVPRQSAQVLKAWSDEGHVLGNHSFSHRWFSGRDPDGAMADILACEPLLRPYRGFRRLFRYPFLAEGQTAGGRDRLRALLKVHGYRIAPVTIDTSDWFVDGRLVARLSADPQADTAPYRRYWLEHLWRHATYYDGLAREVFGRSITHTILLHHRLATGLFLDDALVMFRARGWSLVSAARALADPVLNRSYPTLPAGQSLVWAAAKASGRFEGRLRYPGEDGAYEKPGMDALGL